MRTQYPNPAAVVYPTTQPAGYPCQMTTQTPSEVYALHNHGAFLNRTGRGSTDVQAGHWHSVEGFHVMPDEKDGHTHELTMLPCGWGAAQTTGREGPLGVGAGLGESYLTVLGGDSFISKISLKPLLIGALAVSGLLVGGAILMRSRK